jgi:hypothetical protein
MAPAAGTPVNGVKNSQQMSVDALLSWCPYFSIKSKFPHLYSLYAHTTFPSVFIPFFHNRI